VHGESVERNGLNRGFDLDDQSERFKTPDQAARGLGLVRAFKAVGSEFMVGDLVFQNVVRGSQARTQRLRESRGASAFQT
jgi:hypothetical protein